MEVQEISGNQLFWRLGTYLGRIYVWVVSRRLTGNLRLDVYTRTQTLWAGLSTHLQTWPARVPAGILTVSKCVVNPAQTVCIDTHRPIMYTKLAPCLGTQPAHISFPGMSPASEIMDFNRFHRSS